MCSRDYDVKHPQESLKVKKDKITVSNPRPEGVDRFLEPGEVTPEDL